MPATALTEHPPYEDVSSAPVVYFDGVAANGVMNGAIQLELAQRVLVPNHSGGVHVKFSCSGRLRCSPTAARILIESLTQALAMLEESQDATAASKLVTLLPPKNRLSTTIHPDE